MIFVDIAPEPESSVPPTASPIPAPPADLCARFLAGETVSQLAAAYGRHPVTVRHHLVKAGLYVKAPRKTYTDFGPADIALVRAEYPNAGAAALAARIGCQPNAVRQLAYRLGVKCGVRGRISAAILERNSVYDLTLFDTWTPTAAYLLGYIWADGCVRPDKAGRPAGLSFLCTAADAPFLSRVAAAFGHTKGLRPGKGYVSRHADGKAYQSKPHVKFEVHSTVLARAVVERHGIPFRKSTADAPYPANVPDDVLHHFARGNLDGDGSVGVRLKERRARVNWLGSPRFVRGLAAAICRVAGASPPALSQAEGGKLLVASWTAKADVMRLRDWLYRDAGLCLERKRARFDEAAALLAAVKSYSRRRRKDGTIVTWENEPPGKLPGGKETAC